jgi:hypothetical protein
VPLAITDWIEGRLRDPAVSADFAVVDGTEIRAQDDELLDDLARRFMEAKTSRAYLEAYGGRLDWEFLAQRLAAGPVRVRRGDFGEVVAMGWLEDFVGLEVPIKKLRHQINPGQTLPSTDAVGFAVTDGVIVRSHFLESKLRTTAAFLAEVGAQAYNQLRSDRSERFLEILQFVHERLHEEHHALTEPVTVYLEGRGSTEEDAHEIVLLIESTVWDETVLTNLDNEAGDLPECTTHVIKCTDLAQLIDDTMARIGADLILEMAEE